MRQGHRYMQGETNGLRVPGEPSPQYDELIVSETRTPAAFADARPKLANMLLNQVMISTIATSLAVMLALFAAAVRLPASPCMVTNTPSEKACKMRCCANKTCCKTSQKRTGPPVQSAAKSAADQPNTLAVTAGDGVVLPLRFATDACFFPDFDRAVHSPPTLALICIRLI